MIDSSLAMLLFAINVDSQEMVAVLFCELVASLLFFWPQRDSHSWPKLNEYCRKMSYFNIINSIIPVLPIPMYMYSPR